MPNEKTHMKTQHPITAFLLACIRRFCACRFPALGVLALVGPLRLDFVGDIMTHETQLNHAWNEAAQAYDFEPQFQHIAPFLKGDAVIGNFETVLGGRKPYTGYPAFNTPDALAAALKKTGFSTLLLANNHILDQGARGAERTRRILRESGFEVTGVFPAGARPRPLIIRRKGVAIGIVNGSYGVNAPLTPAQLGGLTVPDLDEERLARDIAWLREQEAEIIIAALHWGEEYQTAPSDRQKRLAALCLRHGADIVVGAHPHVLQPVEIMREHGKTQVVAWSLGNFISAQRTLPRERSIILSLDVARKSPEQRIALQRVRLMPTWVGTAYIPGKGPVLTVYPALPAESLQARTGLAPLENGLKARLDAINWEVLDFLGVSVPPDEDGFYTIYDAQNEPQDPQ